MNKLFLKSLPYTLSLLLSACTGSQDSGTSNNISGLAVDGYLAGAKVYMDVNGNAKHDPYEPWALTDSKGYFGIASDGTDYCASSTTLEHCLNTGEFSGYDIRIQGGYDTVTGEAFKGVISRTLNSSSGQITTPLSSIQGIMSASQITAWLGAENLAASTTLAVSDLSSDPLSITSTTDANQTHLIQTAWLVHKSVSIMAAELKRIYPDDVTGNGSLPTDFTPYGYQALVSVWAANPTEDMLTLLGNPARVDAIMVEAKARLLADGATASAYVPAADIALRIGKLITLIDSNLFTTTAYSQSQIHARARAIEVLSLMLSGITINAGFVDSATTDMSLGLTLTQFEHVATDVSAIAADYLDNGIADLGTDYSARTTLATALPADAATNPIAFTDGASGTADVLIDAANGTVNIDMLVDIDGDMTPDNVTIPGTIEPINDYSSVMVLDTASGPQTIIVETGPAGELIFDTSALQGVEMTDLSTI